MGSILNLSLESMKDWGESESLSALFGESEASSLA